MSATTNSAERWIAHYTRLLAGALSASQRAYAEAELRRWQAQAQRRAA
jgi:hypothetical protein